MGDQDMRGRRGAGGFELLVGFAVGVLTGAVASFLSRRRRRADARDLARRVRDPAGQIPGASREAASAASEAWVVSHSGNGEPGTDAPRR